jgi:hypothetical protein
MLKSNSLQAIEQAIMNLSKEDAYQLSLWLQDYLDDEWDQQIKQDVQSGKLDAILNRVKKDIQEKRVKSLDEILIP